jgi:hypothetical protein
MLSGDVQYVVSYSGKNELNYMRLRRKKMPNKETEVQVGTLGKSCKRKVQHGKKLRRWSFRKTS